MRFTIPLFRENLIYLRKRMLKKLGKIEIPPLQIPAAWKDKNIEDPNDWFQKNEHEWQPSVLDDPRFSNKLQLSDHPNYNDDILYEFNNSTQLLKGEKQALILTKSIKHEGFPEKVEQLIKKLTITDQDKIMQRKIMQAHFWEPTKDKLVKRKTDLKLWKFKAEFGIPPEKRTSIFLKNLLLLQNMGSFENKQFLNDRRTTYNHIVSAQYPFFDSIIWSRFKTEIVISGETTLPSFSSNVKETENVKLPDLYPISPLLDLTHQHIWQEENNLGWLNNFKYKVPHIIYINNNNKNTNEYIDPWSVGQNNARALMSCMAYSTSYAKYLYGFDVKELVKPICIQAVHSDSVNIHFVFFQLNTLDLSNDSGIKNQVWFDSKNALFERKEPKRAMLRNTRLLNYDPYILEKLLAVFSYGILYTG